MTQRAFQLRAARYVIFRGDRLQRSRESRAINVIIHPLPFAVTVPFSSSPGSARACPTHTARRLVRHVTDTSTPHPHPHAGTRDTPVELISRRSRTIAPFRVGHAVPRHDSALNVAEVPFSSSSARSSTSMFTGALSMGYDHLARRRRVMLYHSTQ